MTTNRPTTLSRLAAFVLTFFCGVASSSPAFGAGFEVGENTSLANARGGTGVVSRRDPAAVYFNPALLSRANGYQLRLDTNLINMQLDFARAPQGTREFEPVSNEAGPFPVPFLSTSLELTDRLVVGFGLFGPHSYGRRCMTRIEDGECVVERENAARQMIVGTDLLQVYALLGAGYRFDVADGSLSIGLSAGPAYQDMNLTLVVDQLAPPFGPPYTDNPDQQGAYHARNLRGWTATGIAGVAYERDGFRLGASYRPPMKWRAEGESEIELPQSVRDIGVEVTDERIVLRSNYAGSLRVGWGFAGGQHPGLDELPLYDVEVNVVWENWSVVDNLTVEPQGSVVIAEVQEVPLSPVILPKNYRDAFSLRMGGSYAPATWLSVHAGGFLETAAQSVAYTNADFVSWDRYAASLGATFHVREWLDIDLSATGVFSPDRVVTQGQVYSQLPLSQCQGPDYTDDTCPAPGQPPGIPQNEGRWSSSFQIFGAGLTLKLD